MADSAIDYSQETRLMFVCAIINKLKRLGVLTDALVAAATSFQDLLDDIAAARFVASTTDSKYGEEVTILIRHLEAELKFMESIGLIDNTITTNLTTVNTASASTDLRYLAASKVTVNGFDAADERMAAEAAFGAVSYGSGL